MKKVTADGRGKKISMQTIRNYGKSTSTSWRFFRESERERKEKKKKIVRNLLGRHPKKPDRNLGGDYKELRLKLLVVCHVIYVGGRQSNDNKKTLISSHHAGLDQTMRRKRDKETGR